jgi:hypothetical protein
MNLGASAIATLKLGSQQVSRVMLGAQEVWSAVSMDADAAAYIAAVEGDGITVTATQKSALDAFYKTGKSDGWYSSIKRMYLPIWANATPNERCMVSGTSGTFAGTVAHEAGYVQGDRSTGYFNTGVNQAGVEIDNATALMGVLVSQADTVNNAANFIGVQNVSCTRLYKQTNTEFRGEHPSTSVSSQLKLSSASVGILTMSATANNYRRLSKRITAGVTSITNTDTNTAANRAENIYVLARNVSNTPSSFTDACIGSAFLGTGMSDGITDDFTLALKTLWETCTGLSLP